MFKNLLEVQKIDLKLEELESKLKQLNKFLQDKGADDQVKEMTAKLEAFKASIKEKELELDRLTGEIQITEEKIKAENEKLYSGKITKPKELQAIEEEVKALEKRVQALNEEKEELKKELLSGKEKIVEAEKLVNEFSEKMERERKEKLKAKTEIESEIRSLKERREEIVRKTKPEYYKLYVSLRERYGGEVVVEISDRACMGCFVEMAAKDYEKVIKSQDEINLCPNCGRILIPEKVSE